MKSPRHLDAVKAMMAGAGTISFDQRLRAPRIKSAEQAIADDWRAVGGYLRRAMPNRG